MYRLEKIKLSIRAQNHLGGLKSKIGMPVNVFARFGICLSLNDPSVPNPYMYDEKGMDLLPHVLFGRHETVFSLLLQQRLREDKLDYEEHAGRMLRAHANRGAGMLFKRVNRLEDFEGLLRTAAV